MTIQFSAIGLIAEDMPATLAFYRRLGMDIPVDAEAEPHVEATAGGVRLMWDRADLVRSLEPEWTWPSGGHRMALAFDCGSPADVDATHAALLAAGHRSHAEPWDAPWGQRYASVLDPDGNPVDLFAAL